MKKIGLYIHIPFCTKKCKYCDFVSYTNYNTNLLSNYFSSLKRELYLYNHLDFKIDTIYIGGGTPTAVDSRYIVELLEYIYSHFQIDEGIEITIEANPESITKEKLHHYKDYGINRLSIGIQSFSDVELQYLGRIHSSEKGLYAINIGADYFDNINVDLMIGIPYQNINTFLYSLDKALSLGVKHISIYSLKIEENTELYKLYHYIKLLLPSEDDERKMYWLAHDILNENKYEHYEISNYSKEGFFSKHNLKYWNYDDYIGIGCAAHSFINNHRLANISDLEGYIEAVLKNKKAVVQDEIIDYDESMKEYIILSLRKIEGLNINHFNNKFGLDFIKKYKKELDKLQAKDLIYLNKNTVSLTKKGIDFANIVWREFI